MNRVQAAALAALVAGAAYLPALGNRFALDDGAIVERNPAAHEVAAAVRAAARPYWPAEHAAGLWRPAVMLSFAVDWEVARGNPHVLHAANLAWHALATALLVAWLWSLVPGAPALVAGILFAVHPVHVEAVANLVGRAELMAAVFVLASLLIARTIRDRRARGLPTALEEALLVPAVALALLCKESAVVAIALVALDEWADDQRPARLPLRDYVALAGLTIAWFAVRRVVEGGVSFAQVAPTFFHLHTAGRLATMLPVVLVLLRLLLWPFDLSADYHPRIVERLTSLTAGGVLGLVVLGALAALAVVAWRRNRTAALGIIVVFAAWLPTSNLLFPTGIVIAERTLYLPSVGLALVVAACYPWLRARIPGRALAALGVVALAAFAIRTATRAVVWKDNRALVVASLREHPESYKVHEAAARVFMHLGESRTALREYRTAVELYPLDHYLLTEVGATEKDMGRLPQALATLRSAERLDSSYALAHQLLANVLLLMDSGPAALGEARRAVRADPRRAGAARMVAAAWIRLGEGDSAMAVWPAFARAGGRRFERWLYASSTFVALGRRDEARSAFDSALVGLPQDSLIMSQLREAQQLLASPELR